MNGWIIKININQVRKSKFKCAEKSGTSDQNFSNLWRMSFWLFLLTNYINIVHLDPNESHSCSVQPHTYENISREMYHAST